jgi:DNA-binding CsgD family transcriptional regulator
MEVSRVYIWIVFLFCLALAAGGVLVLLRHQRYRQHRAVRYLLYYLILTYTFGFYALWSQLWFRVLFVTSDSHDRLAPFADFLVMISIPFLLVGKLMLVLWARQLLVGTARPLRYPLVGALLPAGGILYLATTRFQPPLSSYQLLSALVLVVMTALGTYLLLAGTRYFSGRSGWVLAGLLLLAGGIHAPGFLAAAVPPAFELAFVFLFFLLPTTLGVYFAYAAEWPVVPPEVVEQAPPPVADFAQFIKQYGLTPREAEIVREISRGKANQEIADALFVTLQTVKDHTHRIYQKTNVKSRAQLTSLLRGVPH